MTLLAFATLPLHLPRRGHRSSLLSRLRLDVQDYAAKRRQRIALENLDTHLRKDIGLPPLDDRGTRTRAKLSGQYL